ncbi:MULTISPECIES: hypothetical protein [Xanthomonas]|uniref:Aminopeptidase n=1 Tax=Xanthomonas cucurbitae TaxID=56453 RepID=A0ABY7YBU4_9XANT|nr:hypothetical protein [Xanthomonas cucurbitae]WDM67477.1 hypothetical protein K6981_18780 [Xanthomonas cucurbitae]WDM71353.1 hypothetical protein K6978_18745 [Xanthomonas cucurbitae]WDM75671.1 hypothetical protein K6982_01035 [Xanthomonas cucurbitae]
MTDFTNIDADRARLISSTVPASREETLAFFENIIGFAAEQQRSNGATVALAKNAHTNQGIEYAILTLSTRGFDVKPAGDPEARTYLVKW